MARSMKRQIYFVINNLSAATPTEQSSPMVMSFNGGGNSGKMKLMGRSATNSSELLMQASPILYDTLTIDFPIDFIQTSNPRFISIKNAKYYSYINDNEPAEVSVCSDIIQNEKYSDSFLCFCNENHQYKILQIYDARANFYLWLKNNRGEIMDLDPAKGRIFLELLLEF
jgi:hypothetical protein